MNPHHPSICDQVSLCLLCLGALAHDSWVGESTWTHRSSNLICKMEPMTPMSWDCMWGMHSTPLICREYFKFVDVASPILLSSSLIQPSSNASGNRPGAEGYESHSTPSPGEMLLTNREMLWSVKIWVDLMWLIKLTRPMLIVFRKVAFYGQIGSGCLQLLCSSDSAVWLLLTAMIWLFLLDSLLY